MFPVNSTSVETERIARAIKVFQRHPAQAAKVTSAGLFVCKTTVGTTLYSGHSFGDAVDLMCVGDDIADVAKTVIRDAELRTKENFGKRTAVVFVIWNDRQWVAGHGESQYTGVPHTNHVHVGCSFSTTARPKCDGGCNYKVPYLHGSPGC